MSIANVDSERIMVKGFNHETDNEREVAISLGLCRNADPVLPVDITGSYDSERKIMMPNGDIETTAYEPKTLLVKAGNVEIVASHPVNSWTVLVDGVPIRRLRKTVVTMEVGSATTVEVTTIPDYSEKR